MIKRLFRGGILLPEPVYAPDSYFNYHLCMFIVQRKAVLSLLLLLEMLLRRLLVLLLLLLLSRLLLLLLLCTMQPHISKI